jgi:uncharacterized protein (DUF433 family)
MYDSVFAIMLQRIAGKSRPFSYRALELKSDCVIRQGEREINTVPKLDYRNIERDPARCGGQPVVFGTRIRVAVILGCYRQGMSVEEIVQQYPALKPADVHDALAYAYDHIDEIEADLAADDEAAVKAQYSGGTSPP